MLRNRKKKPGVDDDNEKGNKIMRQDVARTKSTVLFVGFMCFLAAGALLVFQDSTDFDVFRGDGKYSLRRMRGLKKAGEVKRHTLLPPDSIYHLQAKDCDGNSIDLEQFAGSVSLVVNVASQ